MIKTYTATAMIVIALVAGVSASSITPALAQSGLHFVGTPTISATKTATSAFLTSTGEVAGAGRTATATLSATAEVTQGCINKGGGNPSGLQRTTTTVTGTETFNTRSGRGTFDVSTTPITFPSGGFSCPSHNMTPTVVSVVFTGVKLTVTSQTGTITQDFGTVDP
jgi:hypothetical protein